MSPKLSPISLLFALLLSGCPGPKPIQHQPLEWKVLMPAMLPAGRTAVAAILDDTRGNEATGPKRFSLDGGSNFGSFAGATKYGSGSLESGVVLSGNYELHVRNESGSEVFAQTLRAGDFPHRRLAGVLTGQDLIWDSTSFVELTGTVTVGAGATLTIGAGTTILIAPSANIISSGTIEAIGADRAAITFMPAEVNSPWGGIYLDGGEATLQKVILTGGGGDASRTFGHSGSQPVIGGREARLTANDVAIVRNIGKAFGFERSKINLSGSLIQRCDTGGEFSGCQLVIDDCRFLDLPNDDESEIDDDNDALYLNAPMGTDTTFIRHSSFATGKDDAIDHNGAIVVVSDCVIDGFDNEGVAASNANYIRVENCLIINCEQGIEAGYGSPLVEVNHCTVRNCATGLRFGDWYNWGCTGTLEVRNTISIDNSLHNVWNYDVASDGPVENATDIRYSIVNDSLYDSNEGCLVGVPNLDSGGRLLTGSIGKRAGSDGKDIGRMRDEG